MEWKPPRYRYEENNVSYATGYRGEGITSVYVLPLKEERIKQSLGYGGTRNLVQSKTKNKKTRNANCEVFSFRQKLWYKFSKFCDASTLHGLRYLSENNRSYIEKIFWIIGLLATYVACGMLIKYSIETWLSKPVIVTIENLPTPVAEIPFPAITVCSSNQLKPSAFNLSQVITNPSEFFSYPNSSSTVDYASAICHIRLNEYYNDGETIPPDIIDYMAKNGHTTCEETIKFISWTNKDSDKPCAMFQPIMTNFGLCFSYNMIPLRSLLTDDYYNVTRIYNNKENLWSTKDVKWKPDTGYMGSVSHTDIPLRTFGSGIFDSLLMSLDFHQSDYDGLCTGSSRGFVIMMHNPAELPSLTHVKFGVNLNTFQWAVVEPKILKTASEVMVWPPEYRGCYFDTERKLQYFKIYTQQNCKLECESNYLLSYCECVPYYSPRAVSTPVCGPAKIQCIRDTLIRYGQETEISNCNCLRECTMISYDAAIMAFDSQWSFKNIYPKNSKPTTNASQDSIDDSEGTSTLGISYQSSDISPLIRVSLHSFRDFIGNVGGIMSLFLGFSWISLLEIIYFLTLRPIVNLWNNQNE